MIGTRSLLAGAMGAGPLVYYFTQVWRARLRPWCDWSPWLHRREPQEIAGGDGTMEILVGRREVSGRGER